MFTAREIASLFIINDELGRDQECTATYPRVHFAVGGLVGR